MIVLQTYSFTTAFCQPFRKLDQRRESATKPTLNACYYPRVSSNPSLLFLSPCLCSTGPVPDIPSPSHYSCYSRCRGIHRGSNIKIEYRLSCRFWWARIIVDHVAHILLCSVWCLPLYIPVMPIKWRFAASTVSSDTTSKKENLPKFGGIDLAQSLYNLCLWRHFFGSTLKPQ